jgi:malate/lactate dehydrogenase
MAVPVPASRPYGITEGLIFSFPVTVDPKGNVHIVEGLELTPYVREKLAATEKELLEEKATAWKVLNLE